MLASVKRFFLWHHQRMARSDPQLNFRIPADLRDRLEAAAAQNKRSLTQELVERLEASLAESDRGGAAKWESPSEETMRLISTTIQQTMESLYDAGWTPPQPKMPGLLSSENWTDQGTSSEPVTPNLGLAPGPDLTAKPKAPKKVGSKGST